MGFVRAERGLLSAMNSFFVSSAIVFEWTSGNQADSVPSLDRRRPGSVQCFHGRLWWKDSEGKGHGKGCLHDEISGRRLFGEKPLRGSGKG